MNFERIKQRTTGYVFGLTFRQVVKNSNEHKKAGLHFAPPLRRYLCRDTFAKRFPTPLDHFFSLVQPENLRRLRTLRRRNQINRVWFLQLVAFVDAPFLHLKSKINISIEKTQNLFREQPYLDFRQLLAFSAGKLGRCARKQNAVDSLPQRTVDESS